MNVPGGLYRLVVRFWLRKAEGLIGWLGLVMCWDKCLL